MRIRAITRATAALATAALIVTGMSTTAQADDDTITGDRIQGEFRTLPWSYPEASSGTGTIEGWQADETGTLTADNGSTKRAGNTADSFKANSSQWNDRVSADTISAPAPGTSGVVRFETGAAAGTCLALDMASVTDCAGAPAFTWMAAGGKGSKSSRSELSVLINAENTPFRDRSRTGTSRHDRAGSHFAAGFNLCKFKPVKPVSGAPTASIVALVDGLDAGFDGSASKASSRRSITSYAWDFGDGTTGTGTTVNHTYAEAGTYTVRLTVTDSCRATGTTTTTITVTSPSVPDPEPTVTTQAIIEVSSSELKAMFDGSKSSSSDGTPITSYAWDFGDGATASGVSTSHVYPASGAYTVTLTVTDEAGRTATATQSITVTAKSPIVYDTWGRTSTTSWGTANVGGTWLGATGLAIEGAGVGTMTFDQTGKTIQTYLNKVSAQDVDVTLAVSFDALTGGNGTMLGSIVRKSAAGNYRVKLVTTADGTMTVNLVRYIGTTEAYLATYTVPAAYTPGQVLNVRFQAVGAGTTTLAAKVWPAGTTEPFTWQVTTTDDTPELQGPGYVGFAGYISGLAPSANDQKIRIDNYRIVKP